jgi:hypothetical protein
MGYGRSYDIGVFGSNFGHTVTQNLPVLLKQSVDATAFNPLAAGSKVPVFLLDNGPIAATFPAVPSNGLIPFSALGGQVSGVHIRPTSQVLPTVDSWNATVQRQITNTVSAEVAYVGSKGTHGFAGDGPNYDVNPPSVVGFTQGLTQNERRPLFPKIPFGLGNFYGNDAGSTYNAFEVKVEKRFASGLQFLSHYTYAHADGYDGSYYAIDHKIAWGPVDFNRNHVFVFNTVYELPFGKGKKFMGGASRAADYVVGGWQVSNTTNWSSGLPFTPSFAECGAEEDVGVCRPNKGTGSFHTGLGSLDPIKHTITYFTPVPNIVTTPGAFADPGKGNLGNIGRNILHGPAGFYSDMSAVKKFRITERLNAQFRVDAFNVFNHPVYAFSQNNGANGCIDCQGGNNGKITGLEGGSTMRQLQFAIRFDF